MSSWKNCRRRAELLRLVYEHLIENIEKLLGNNKSWKKTFDFGIQPIMEDQDFIVLDYEEGKRLRLSTK